MIEILTGWVEASKNEYKDLIYEYFHPKFLLLTTFNSPFVKVPVLSKQQYLQQLVSINLASLNNKPFLQVLKFQLN